MQLNISKGGGGGAEQWERDFYDNRYYNLACNGYYTIPPTVVYTTFKLSINWNSYYHRQFT